MDYYIEQFCNQRPNDTVRDYAVYLETGRGPARLNPFRVAKQLVVYLTDHGAFALTVQGAASFSVPEHIDPVSPICFADHGKTVLYGHSRDRYRFVRKQRHGLHPTAEAFAKAVSHN